MNWKQDGDVSSLMLALIKAREFRQKVKKKLNWNKSMNLLAFAVVFFILILFAWLFWPHISAAWNQFLAFRNQLNITTP